MDSADCPPPAYLEAVSSHSRRNHPLLVPPSLRYAVSFEAYYVPILSQRTCVWFGRSYGTSFARSPLDRFRDSITIAPKPPKFLLFSFFGLLIVRSTVSAISTRSHAKQTRAFPITGFFFPSLVGGFIVDGVGPMPWMLAVMRARSSMLHERPPGS